MVFSVSDVMSKTISPRDRLATGSNIKLIDNGIT